MESKEVGGFADGCFFWDGELVVRHRAVRMTVALSPYFRSFKKAADAGSTSADVCEEGLECPPRFAQDAGMRRRLSLKQYKVKVGQLRFGARDRGIGCASGIDQHCEKVIANQA